VRSSAAYFASRPIARALRASPTLNQVGLRFVLGRLGVTDLQEESLHDEFLDAIAQPGDAFWL